MTTEEETQSCVGVDGMPKVLNRAGPWVAGGVRDASTPGTPCILGTALGIHRLQNEQDPDWSSLNLRAVDN